MCGGFLEAMEPDVPENFIMGYVVTVASGLENQQTAALQARVRGLFEGQKNLSVLFMSNKKEQRIRINIYGLYKDTSMPESTKSGIEKAVLDTIGAISSGGYWTHRESSSPSPSSPLNRSPYARPF